MATTTVRDLRHILFDIDDQDLTVREVRAILFDMEQDVPVDARTIRRAS